MQVIYGDVLFLVNFTMDFLSLFITGKLRAQRLRPARLLMASSIGGVYGVAAVFLPGNIWISAVTTAAVSLLLTYISFESRILSGAAIFFAVSVAMGGAMTALWNFLNKLRNAGADLPVTGLSGMPPGKFLLMAIFCGTAALFCGRLFGKRGSAGTASVELRLDGKKMHINGLCDSGNLLTEPLSGLPVLLLPVKSAAELLPVGGVRDALLSNDARKMAELNRAHARRLRVIPMKTAGNSGILLGVRPDACRINGMESSVYLAFCEVEEAIIPASAVPNDEGILQILFKKKTKNRS